MFLQPTAFYQKERKLRLTPAPQSLYDRFNRNAVSQRDGKICFGKDPIIKLQQSEVVFTSDLIRIIASSGAGPCIIFAVRERETGQGFLAHVYTAAEIMPVIHGGAWLLEKLNEMYRGGTLDVYMVGGYTCLSTCLLAGLDTAVQHIDANYKLGNVYKQLTQNWVSNVVLDFDSGAIYQYDDSLDRSSARPINYSQALLTSGLNFFCCPFTRLWEHKPEPEELVVEGRSVTCWF